MASPNLYQLAMALVAALAISASFQFVMGADQDPPQDFCVAIIGATPNINGFPCKPVADTEGADFKSSLLATPGNTNNRNNATVTEITVNSFPGLNTLGISGERIDFAVGGLNPPHLHLRATELFFLIQGGPVEVGIVSSNGNTLFQDVINTGDVFVFPRGLLHFQKNRGDGPAVAVAGLSSQNPGVQQAARALFASTPNVIASDVLQQTLGVGAGVVEQLVDGQK